MKKLFFFLLVTFPIFYSLSAQDSCNLRISLLTCSPGQELYSSFGHTALRVQDQGRGTEEIYNYGTFEFNDDFYLKFVRGKLNYFLSIQSMDEFMWQYKEEGRSVKEQELQFSCDEKQKLLASLINNAKEENKYFRYDFLFDNCTTRAGVIVEKTTDSPVAFKNILPENPPTFRNMIHDYLEAGHQYWSKLGIDILLGAKLDRKATNSEAIFFLPDYLMKGFDSAFVNGKPLVHPATTILERSTANNDKPFFTPLVVFIILSVLVVILSLIKTKWARITLSIFDFLFFFFLGLAGLLLLFMWFGTDHNTTQNNYNLLWALPTHVVMAFYVHSNKDWVKKYFKIVFWLTVALVLLWFFLPQEMNFALIPIVLLISYRTFHLSKKQHAGKDRIS